LFSLAGCSGGFGSSIKQFGTTGKLDISPRMELRADFDEPMLSGKEPCPHRREIYDQDDKSGSMFDQCFGVVGTFKF
jgi:hypothetical protein